jgi:H+/gluconate symporter-like permease
MIERMAARAFGFVFWIFGDGFKLFENDRFARQPLGHTLKGMSAVFVIIIVVIVGDEVLRREKTE